MNRNPRRALIAATLLLLGGGGCTDTTELPTSTITDTNYFDDPSSYRAFLARIYSGLAVTGQRGILVPSTRVSPSTCVSTGSCRRTRPTRR
jgi:hypothetical protein